MKNQMKNIWLFLMLFISMPAYSQDLSFFKAPEFYQLYARDDTDSALVEIIGETRKNEVSNMKMQVFKDNVIYDEQEKKITNEFSFKTKICAGLFEYSFKLFFNDSLCFQADSVVCGDAYILTGQSNSHSASKFAVYSNEFCRSFGVKTGSDPYTDVHRKIRWGRASGTWPYQLHNYTKEADGIGGWFDQIEFGVGVMGITFMQKIIEKYEIPICLINGGSGGSPIEDNMMYPYLPSLETSFGRLAYRVYQAGLKDKVKAIIWHQGESNTHNETYLNYYDNFMTLFQQWKSVYLGLKKIYMFQIRPGCIGMHQSELMQTQSDIADALPNDIRLISTCGLEGHNGCHYTHQGYVNMAGYLFDFVSEDFYDSPIKIISPKLLDIKCTKISEDKTSKKKSYTLELTYNCNLNFDKPITFDNQVYDLKTLFSIRMNKADEIVKNVIKSAYLQDNKVFLEISDIDDVEELYVSYLPGKYYWGTDRPYMGPWLRSQANGIGALAFDKYCVKMGNE